jgi:hypothetical protein
MIELLVAFLAPIGVACDFLNNPAAPPQIFVAQFEQSFGHPPSLPVRPKLHKRVTVTQG